jgi:protein-S-isoprenylcysteine O-methyltransferase Ste14
MSRFLSFGYGVIAYLLFLVSFLYAIGFVGDFLVPKGINDGTGASLTTALIVDLALMALFAIQHSVMARPGFKRWWTRFVPRQIERSTYVLLSSLILLLLYWQWIPMTGTVWSVSGPGAIALWVLFGLGWTIVFLSTLMIGHWNLFGLEQVYLHLKNLKPKKPSFVTPGFYKLVRHPIMVGFIIAFWAIPYMTVGHLLFAAVTTAYILIAIQFEERDLINELGEPYATYRTQVRGLVPVPKASRSGRSVYRR